jgi:peptide/nickel transport system substrate-binding protein
LRPAAYDQAQAVALLKSIGLTDRNGDGLLDDARGRTASFEILTQKGNSVREGTAAVVQEQLRKIGLKVDVVPLEAKSMRQQWQDITTTRSCMASSSTRSIRRATWSSG